MIDAPAFLEHVKVAGERIAEVASRADLSVEVPSCPGMSLRELVGHTASFSGWVATIVENGQPVAPGHVDPDGDVLAEHITNHTKLVATLGAKDPDGDCWAWGTDQHTRFWFRRAAQELGMHRWDVENAAGEPRPFDAMLAADGFDELLEEFGPNNPFFKGAADKFAGNGERIAFEATDIGRRWVVTARPETFEVSSDGDADATAKAVASDILLFGWGRLGPDVLEITGDSVLLDRWHDDVKI